MQAESRMRFDPQRITRIMRISLLSCNDIGVTITCARAQTEVVSRVDDVHLRDAMPIRPMISGSVWTSPDRAGLSGNNRPFCELRSCRHYRRFGVTSGWMCKRTSVIVIRVNVNNAAASTGSPDNKRRRWDGWERKRMRARSACWWLPEVAKAKCS